MRVAGLCLRAPGRVKRPMNRSAVPRAQLAREIAHELFGGTGTVFNTNNLLYVAVKITNITLAQAEDVNRLVDGRNDPDQPVAGSVLAGTNTTGRFRYTTTPAGTTTAFYLATPIPQ